MDRAFGAMREGQATKTGRGRLSPAPSPRRRPAPERAAAVLLVRALLGRVSVVSERATELLPALPERLAESLVLLRARRLASPRAISGADSPLLEARLEGVATLAEILEALA